MSCSVSHHREPSSPSPTATSTRRSSRRSWSGGLSLVQLLHYCTLIGRELHSDEIFLGGGAGGWSGGWRRSTTWRLSRQDIARLGSHLSSSYVTEALWHKAQSKAWIYFVQADQRSNLTPETRTEVWVWGFRSDDELRNLHLFLKVSRSIWFGKEGDKNQRS